MAKLVTLLTDFGTTDPYLAEMKAAMYAVWRRQDWLGDWPRIVDLGHEIPPGDIAAAAWFLARVSGQYPAGTIHVVVIDPGVGTGRPLVAVAALDQLFVGPGNGVFAFLSCAADLEITLLDDPQYHQSLKGRAPALTFQGRDVFAPVAALLAAGKPLGELGTPGGIEHLGRRPDGPSGAGPGADRIGTIVWIDRFGNAITDIVRDGPLGKRLSEGESVEAAGIVAAGPYATFGAGPDREPFWYWGSGGTLELALRDRSAAQTYDWRRGLAIRLTEP